MCGQTQRTRVYEVGAFHVQAAIAKLTDRCESAALLIRPGVGMLSDDVRIAGTDCPTGKISISLVGNQSTAAVPSTRLLMRKHQIAISRGAEVCMQDIALQDGASPMGKALWVVVQAKLRMRRCSISNCEATSGDGGAITLGVGSSADLVQCHFANNRALVEHGGAFAWWRICVTCQLCV